jgi:hypothetical protein
MATTSTEFGTSQLFFADARLVLAMLNHLRYQALHSTLGLSREQANVLTVVVLLSAADGAYEATRRITGIRPHLAGADAAIGAAAVREASLSLAGPSVRAIPGLGGLVVVALVGRFALPALRRSVQRARAAEQRLRAAEQRVRRERIRRYAAARDRAQPREA